MSGGRVWAVTSYFNPLGYRSRRENYGEFARRLGLPLLAVELGFERGFDLDGDDADILVRVADGDLLWQKERLLNLAWARLPAECDAVAWIDCDVLLADDDWPARARRELDRSPLVQPFDHLVHLRAGELPESAAPPSPAAERRSFAALWRRGLAPPDIFRRPAATSELRCTCGMAWMARRELLSRHGLYDTMVLGMGDKQFAAAAVGRAADAAAALRMSPGHAAHYLRWAAPLAAEIAGAVGYVAGAAHHLWHGELADRRYVERYERFSTFEFDPDDDLVAATGGAWRWRNDRPELRAHVRDYFAGRREDRAVDPAASLG